MSWQNIEIFYAGLNLFVCLRSTAGSLIAPRTFGGQIGAAAGRGDIVTQTTPPRLCVDGHGVFAAVRPWPMDLRTDLPAGNGLLIIVADALPLNLFGSDGSGKLQGRRMASELVLLALAP